MWFYLSYEGTFHVCCNKRSASSGFYLRFDDVFNCVFVYVLQFMASSHNSPLVTVNVVNLFEPVYGFFF